MSSDPHPHLWFPFTYYEDFVANPPITIERGEGLYLIDGDGKRYLDAIGSWWVSVLGHKHPHITGRVRAQLDKLEHCMMAGFITPVAAELAERLGPRLPDGMTKLFYSDNGSTAVEVAMKIALQFWALRGSERSEFVSLGGDYHGDTLATMAVGSIPFYHDLFHERFHKCHFTHPPANWSGELNAEDCEAECLRSLNAILDERGDHIAAMLIEPMIQGASGMRVYSAGLLAAIYDACRAHDVLVIADEVAVGFGRTGTMWASEHANRTPDILCTAKALTGGYLPLSATAVSDQVFEEFKGGPGSDRILNHGHTFTGNPLAAAAACGALELFDELDLPGSLAPKIERFQVRLQTFWDLDGVGDVRGLGMIGAIELGADRAKRRKFGPNVRIGQRVYREALDRGVILRPLGDVVYFVPAFTISDAEMDEMFDVAQASIESVVASLPSEAFTVGGPPPTSLSW